MCSVWTVCQSMPRKPLVKIGTGAPLPVLQRASSLQRLIAEAGSCLCLSCFTLQQVQAAPGNYSSSLKFPGCFWKVRFDELLRQEWNENHCDPSLGYSFLKVSNLLHRLWSSFPVFFLMPFSKTLQPRTLQQTIWSSWCSWSIQQSLQLKTLLFKSSFDRLSLLKLWSSAPPAVLSSIT